MTEESDRTKKLEWIREGMQWVVGISGGLVGVSATYFYDRFDQVPRYRWMLWLAWFLLVVASLAGILATQAAWKNIGGAGDFKRWLRWSYGIAMWTFVFGFVFLAGVLVVNVGSSTKPHGTADIFAAGDTLPSFEPASAAGGDVRFVTVVCEIRQAFLDSGSTSALDVGRVDRRELSDKAQPRSGVVVELAQRRADRIGALLTDSTLCRNRPMHSVVTLTGGPRHDASPGATPAVLEGLLAADRRVEVYGFRVQR